MKKDFDQRPPVLRVKLNQQCGFTLIELLVSMAVFMVIAGGALSLFRRHAPLFSSQQSQMALNIGLRNAASQMQIDAINAGSGFAVNIPGWNPVGLTVINREPATGDTCHDAATHTYGPNCFDTFSVIAADPATPASRPSTSGGACVSTTSSDLYLTPISPTTATQLAAMYKTGDQVMVVKADGSKLTAVVLTADGSVSGSRVRLVHQVTASDGSNTAANDPPQITTNFAGTGKLSSGTYCLTDWAYKLSVVTYGVDTSTQSNPKLVRTQNGSSSVVAEQIIGFKVGAMTWNAPSDGYIYDPTDYNPDYDWTTIRSLRISLIGRTAPITDPNVTYKNTFDDGPYKIQAVSFVINPRNLSMND